MSPEVATPEMNPDESKVVMCVPGQRWVYRRNQRAISSIVDS